MSSTSIAAMRRKARTLLSVYFADTLQYRAEILLWALSNILPLIMMGLWVRVSEQGDFGMEPMDFVRYFFAVFIVRQFTVVWVIWEFEFHVVEGRLSPLLLQPMDPGWRFLALHVAERVTRLPFTIGFAVLFFVLYPASFWWPQLSAAVIAIIVVTAAFLLRFLIQYTWGMFAFWVERASAIEHMMWIPYVFLSGLVAPLEVYPPLLREIALWTPFPYMVWYPGMLLVRGPAALDVGVAQAALVMAAWTLGFFALNRWLWRQGLKQYSAMGA